MFADEFVMLLMLNEPKVETSSDLPRKPSLIFGKVQIMLRNVHMAFEQHSDNLRKSLV